MFTAELFCFLAFLLLCSAAYGQYTGGGEDGFAVASFGRVNITDMVAFHGGPGDGFSSSNLNKLNITDSTAFRGGSGDGFTVSNFSRLNITDSGAFHGGSDDGFAVSTFNKPDITDPNAFGGGSGDGFTVSNFSRLNSTDSGAFHGGSDDGFTVFTFNKPGITDPNAFGGGSGDGFTVTNFSRLNITDPNSFRGGTGDGFTVSIYLKGSALPLTLISFSGRWMNNTASLSWQTVSETNVSGFILERSFTGEDFSEIATVAASVNSNSLRSYTYDDLDAATLNPGRRQFFYRIKTVDKDGKLYYSAIIILVKDPERNFNVTLYPNPANTLINIRVEGMSDSDRLSLSIRNMDGRLLSQKKVTANPGQLDTYRLSPGQYLIIIYRNDQRLKTIPVIIQH